MIVKNIRSASHRRLKTNNVHAEDAETRMKGQADSRKEQITYNLRREARKTGQAVFREASGTNYVQAEVGRQGKVVRLSSMKHREQITYRLRMRTRKSGQAFFMEASRPNHVQAEGAETRKSGEAVFKEASRTNYVHAEESETRKSG